MEIVFGLIVGYVGAFIYEYIGISISKRNKKPPHLDVHGYRLHHSLYGLVFLILGVLFRNSFPASAGVGIVIQHYFTGDGLVFITRVR